MPTAWLILSRSFCGSEQELCLQEKFLAGARVNGHGRVMAGGVRVGPGREGHPKRSSGIQKLKYSTDGGGGSVRIIYCLNPDTLACESGLYS